MKSSTFFCFLLINIIICDINTSYGQKYSPKYLREKTKALLALTSKATENGWLEFRQDKDTEAINPDEFFTRFRANLGLGEGYHLKQTRDETDFREMRHQRFQLYYKNIRVEGVEYSLHSRNKRLQTAHGRIVEDLLLDVSKPMFERKALEIALTDQKLTLDDLKGKDLPKGELLIVRLGEEVISQNFKLCYAFDILVDGITKRSALGTPTNLCGCHYRTGCSESRAHQPLF
ncbi:hypothetical protein [Spirosoma sp. KNUC1025]|uniref:hypothetical protein n=1 Tax=Spirosoma sp. KNUC1025 TaxID=2894082 RepID=UPI00386E3FA7|nr:hypothetical protein LN737_24605 [Spirosoma sp. KNUC1025]